MRIAQDLPRFQPARASYVTIGVFDGIHRGHQKLLSEMVEAAHAAASVAVAITFDPHPTVALGHPPPPLLTTIEERAALLSTLGLDDLLVLPFTSTLARTSAADFIALLQRRLRMAALWGGPNMALGHRREGNVAFLRRLGAERGFDVHIVEPVMWEGALISSSRVRAALQAGDVAQAAGCLGRPYRLAGVVVHGDGRGRKLGIPTANIMPPPERLIPAHGVYACLAHIERGGTLQAVTNIGVRPTFAGRAQVVEAHLLDMDADLYGQTLTLDFIARLREELAFSSAQALVEQMRQDIAQAREMWEREKRTAASTTAR